MVHLEVKYGKRNSGFDAALLPPRNADAAEEEEAEAEEEGAAEKEDC